MTAPVVAQLRRATWRDIPRLAELDVDLFAQDAWSERTWWDEFAERPRRDYVVAVRETPDGEQIVGYAGLDRSGSVADVMTVAVTPSVRGLGLGRILMNYLIETAGASGAEALLLEVRADNAPALSLYDSLGFDRLTIRRRYYQPGDVDAVIMRRLLAPQEAP